MEVKIAPSILSADFGKLAETVQELEKLDCDWIHLDVMDGHFVPPITFGSQAVAALRKYSTKVFDCHLMVEHPETHVESFCDAGADRLIVHQEACRHLHRVLESIREAGMSAGVAINPGTPVASVAEVLELVDLILVMTVNPGWGGQKFISSCLEKVKQARGLSRSVHVQVDGGIDAQTAPGVVLAGADVLVAGNFIFSGNVGERILQLRRAACGVSVS